MLVILAILAATRASPFGLRSPPIVSQDQLQVTQPSCDDPHGCRSLGDIIRSCIVTILLCTWVSMHPNIPSPDERWPRLALRRAGLMLLALFVPEAVIGWALRQRQAAAELAKEHKGES
jgi:cytochrome b561